MKLTTNAMKSLIILLGYKPEDGSDDVYFKQYANHHNYTIRIDFNTEKIEYRNVKIKEKDGIKWGDTTTSNFENSENFVVLECVDRLLEKGYTPHSITLEKKYPLGRILKGKLDIIVTDNEEKPFLMIECKTWGSEYEKELKKMIKDGGQLFSYFANDKAAKYLCLYTSHIHEKKVVYRNDVVPVNNEGWIELSNVKEIHDHWNKNFKDNGVFEDWANAYDVEIKALVRSRLKPLTKDDSGRIFHQFLEILRHNVVSDKPNAFNKILNLFICKIIDEDKNENEQVDFQWLENDTNESLQIRLNDLYKKGMHRFLDIDVTDYSDDDISNKLTNINDKAIMEEIKTMFAKLRLQKNPEFAFVEVYNDQSFKANATVVREVVELLQPYQFRYGHKQQFLGDFFELLLNTSIKQEAGQFFTPVPITRFIVSSLPLKEFIQNKLKTDDPDILPAVIDFACGTGHFLTEYMDKVQSIIESIDVCKAKPSAKRKLGVWRDFDKFDWAKDYVYGIDADYRLVKSSKVNSFLNGDGEANIICANGLDHFTLSKDYKGKLKVASNDNPQDNAQFDVLIANPPYSVSAFKSTVTNGEQSFDLFDRLTDNSSEIECLFIERTKQLLKIGGWAGLILPSSILSNTGTYSAAREIILKYFKIKAITEFGSNTFMATGTNTVTLFMERRPNNDHKLIKSAVDSFFEKPKDTTVLSIEKAFSKYVCEVFENITFEDYSSFISKKPSEAFTKQEVFKDYKNWFDKLTDIKKLKESKSFREMSSSEEKEILNKLFYNKVFEIEKEKLLYFLLTYTQKTVIVKVGEKQDEKDFLGYEFSNRRGHEGIKMSPGGTMLYDETDPLNPKKANRYIYHAFLDIISPIDNSMINNISSVDTTDLFDFAVVEFEKSINLNFKKKQHVSQWKYQGIKIENTIINVVGDTGKIDSKEIYKSGEFPVVSQNREKTIDGYCNGISPATDLPIILFGDHNCCFKYIDFPFVRGGDGTQLLKCNADFLPEYFYYALQAQKEYITNLNKYERHFKYLKELYIPQPPLAIQEKIIAEIKTLEASEKINTEKIEVLRSDLLVPEHFAFPIERIEKITTMVKRGKSASYGSSNIQIIKSGQARGYAKFDFSKKYYVSEKFVSDERNLQKGDVLINSTGVGTAGRVTIFDLAGDFVVDSHITIVRLNKTKAVPKYVLYALANIGFNTIEKMATGQSGQIEISLPIINSIKIPLPPLDEQKIIVSRIETIEKEIQALEAELADAEETKKAILAKYL